MASFNDYINQLKSGRIKKRVKLEWLREDESIESTNVLDILGGNLTKNRNNGVRTSCTIELPYDVSLIPNIYGVWVNKKFKLSLGLKLDNGEDYFIPQGVFVLSNPSYVSEPSGGRITIQANDKFVLLNGENRGILQDIYIIQSGNNINNAIKQILIDFKDTTSPILQESTMTVPYDIRKGYGSNIAEIMKEIAYASSRNIYYDSNGHLVFKNDLDDDFKPSLWDFNSEYDDFCYLGSNLENKFNEIKNVVKVVVDNVNGTPIIGLAKNTNLTSPTNTNLIGEIAEVVINNIIQNQTDANNYANFILKRLLVLSSSISINSMFMCHLDVDEVITLTDNLLEFSRKRFLINSIDIDLSVNGGINISCIDVDEVDFTVGKFGG